MFQHNKIVIKTLCAINIKKQLRENVLKLKETYGDLS